MFLLLLFIPTFGRGHPIAGHMFDAMQQSKSVENTVFQSLQTEIFTPLTAFSSTLTLSERHVTSDWKTREHHQPTVSSSVTSSFISSVTFEVTSVNVEPSHMSESSHMSEKPSHTIEFKTFTDTTSHFTSTADIHESIVTSSFQHHVEMSVTTLEKVVPSTVDVHSPTPIPSTIEITSPTVEISTPTIEIANPTVETTTPTIDIATEIVTIIATSTKTSTLSIQTTPETTPLSEALQVTADLLETIGSSLSHVVKKIKEGVDAMESFQSIPSPQTNQDKTDKETDKETDISYETLDAGQPTFGSSQLFDTPDKSSLASSGGGKLNGMFTSFEATKQSALDLLERPFGPAAGH
jgi:hypothetical protein